MIVEFVGCLPQANIDMELEKLVSFCLWKYGGGGDLAASTNAHIIVVIFWISWLPIHFRWVEWIQSFIKTLLVYLISTVNLHYRSLPFDLPHMDSYLLHFFCRAGTVSNSYFVLWPAKKPSMQTEAELIQECEDGNAYGAANSVPEEHHELFLGFQWGWQKSGGLVPHGRCYSNNIHMPILHSLLHHHSQDSEGR